MNKSVLYLLPTYEGKAHDKSICDEEQIKFDVPVVLWEDLGFMGLTPNNADVRCPIIPFTFVVCTKCIIFDFF